MKPMICIFCILFLINACSSTEQTTQDQANQQEVYVFDDVSKIDSTKKPQLKIEEKSLVKQDSVKIVISPPHTIKYIVQLGAFSTNERAQAFILENQFKTSLPLSISYNDIKKLFVVQILPYNTKEEADIIRDNLKKIPAFKDAFTIISEK